MRFVTFRHNARIAPGVLRDEHHIVDLSGAEAARLKIPGQSLAAVIAGGAPTQAAVRTLIAAAPMGSSLALDEVELLAPIPRPAKNVFCVGRNYVDHVKEGASAGLASGDLPKVPQFFTKPPTAVIGPGAAIRIGPELTAELDYEIELGVIIGTGGRDIPPEAALDHVFGYTIINDISARDLQRSHGQWFKGKALDSSCPIGPWIVTRDEIPSVEELALTLTVNGETRQHARCSQMIFDVPTLIASLSAGLTLEAADIIATGTPAGVGFSFKPPRFLNDGDVVVARIAGIGQLVNPVERP
ncbi:MAG TPA: fumarylacetoacetate hydrolase family protein [Steroidobacteraceae bacterium]|nr:fumarylacetoacetate hydrolase family protein [Steroidobacteraceae bacterium]